MMEEIDLFDQEISPNPFGEEPKSDKNAPASTTSNARKATKPSPRNNNSPLRLPRTTGNGRGKFLRDTLQSQIPTTEQLQNTKKQAGKVLNRLGNQLNKLNLGKLIDNMEQDQGLADSLEQLNSRMKEEVERQEIRREAEELGIKVITDHLGEFLTDHPMGTYEEWIQDLHPENANQGQLLSDIQQIDERFYVMESDHRRLWNEAVEKQQAETNEGNTSSSKISYEHRIVKPRTQIWGKAPGAQTNNKNGFSDTPQNDATIDLLNGSTSPSTSTDVFDASPNNTNGVEQIDFFAPVANSSTNAPAPSGNGANTDPFQDLIQF